MEQTTARLRKAFHYPADNDSDVSLPEALDEEEQENLIRTLRQQNTTANTQYTRILLFLPIACVLPYFPTVFAPRTSLLSLLAISSLLSTAYLLCALPPGISSVSNPDALKSRRPSSTSSHNPGHNLQQIQYYGPIAQYLPALNAVLATVLVVLGVVFKGKEELWVGFAWLPAGVYAVVLVTKSVMGSVDPEAELGSLRYGFKGA